jgi:hypothetical protein
MQKLIVFLNITGYQNLLIFFSDIFFSKNAKDDDRAIVLYNPIINTKYRQLKFKMSDILKIFKITRLFFYNFIFIYEICKYAKIVDSIRILNDQIEIQIQNHIFQILRSKLTEHSIKKEFLEPMDVKSQIPYFCITI